MLRRTIAITTLLALAGCTTIPKQTQRLSATLVGRPVAELDAKYGKPFVFGDRVTIHQYNVVRGKADWSILIPSGSTTSQVSGYVDGHPFQGTVTTPNASPSFGRNNDVQCNLNAFIDADGIVTSIELSGDTWACRKFS